MGSSEELRDLIRETGAFDKSRHLVYFDRIWHRPDKLRICADIIYQKLANIEEGLLKSGINKANLVLLTADSVEGNLGIVPMGFFIAEKLGWHMAIWKEYADVRWGTSAILGYREYNATCILLQDVVDQGTIAIRIAQSIKTLSWKFAVYFSAVLNSENADNGVNNSLDKASLILGERPVFHYIISADEL